MRIFIKHCFCSHFFAKKFGNLKYCFYLCSRKISIAIRIFKVFIGKVKHIIINIMKNKTKNQVDKFPTNTDDSNPYGVNIITDYEEFKALLRQFGAIITE